jgi:hypothetical protein
MGMNEAWALLRAGQTEEGLAQFRRACDLQATPSHVMELGVAYLWSEQYETASDHFHWAVKKYPNSISEFYGMAGAASWCLGQFSEAAGDWSDGLSAQYTDTDGLGVRLPLLLLTASVLRPNVFGRDSAVDLLMQKVEDPRIGSWPGPLVMRVLEHISEPELLNYCDLDETEACQRRWLADFYGAVIRQGTISEPDFKQELLRLTDVSRPEWQDMDFFLACMWSEEFFLARFEAH